VIGDFYKETEHRAWVNEVSVAEFSQPTKQKFETQSKREWTEWGSGECGDGGGGGGGGGSGCVVVGSSESSQHVF
jgi:hypothetical protein